LEGYGVGLLKRNYNHITTMKTPRIFSMLLLIISLQVQLCGQDFKYLDNRVGLSEISASNGIDNPVTIKVVYDNYVKVDGLKSDWGYSIVIEGLEKEILFDAGTKPNIFEYNFNKMGLDADKIDLIVFSHEHGDHTEGLPAFVKMKKDIPVIIPFSFSDTFKSKMVSFGLTPILVKEPAKICENLYTSGEFVYVIPEQALVLNTKNGLTVITGCSHPGIVEMLKEIKSAFNKNIYLVIGGFHLLNKSEKEMDQIISEIKAIGVVKCGATHCTGEKQIKMIRDAFGTNFVELGVGNSILIN
jgi:7,8-dihydropterin-6-yl-methyl-4-(beta-D-ribofuranosyl)aminobenzene 5'-phosphate synthase